jgi:5-amino-6-(5-phospho-D-ribitylamino)uracil phosphatase
MALPAVIVLDLDGTLLRSDKTLSAPTESVLQRLQARGCALVIATARPRRAVVNVLPAWLRAGWVILYNGSQIWLGDQLVCELTISRASLAAILETVRVGFPDAAVGFESGDQLYTNRHFIRHWPADSEEVVDLTTFPLTDTPKIVVDLIDPRLVPLLRGAMPPDCRLLVTDGAMLAQLVPRAAGKAAAVHAILPHLGKTVADVLCFGDDANDAELFAAFPQSVAMANATAALRQAASYHTMSNDEDGVAQFLTVHFDL